MKIITVCGSLRFKKEIMEVSEKMELKGVEPSMPENWTENKQSYQITAIVKIKAEAVNAPIPNYGWENGENVKWIEVEKINGKWYVNGIASGP